MMSQSTRAFPVALVENTHQSYPKSDIRDPAEIRLETKPHIARLCTSSGGRCYEAVLWQTLPVGAREDEPEPREGGGVGVARLSRAAGGGSHTAFVSASSTGND